MKRNPPSRWFVTLAILSTLATMACGVSGSSPSAMAPGAADGLQAQGLTPSIPTPLGIDPGTVGGNIWTLAHVAEFNINAEMVFISQTDFQGLIDAELGRRANNQFQGPGESTPESLIFIEPYTRTERNAASVAPGCFVCPEISVDTSDFSHPIAFTAVVLPDGRQGFLGQCLQNLDPQCVPPGPQGSPGHGLNP